MKLLPWLLYYAVITRVSFFHLDSQFDSQYRLQSLPLVYTSEQSSLLPGAYFHVALEQVAGDDEMLDLILQQEVT